MGEPWPVGSEGGTLEHVENSVWEEYVGKSLANHVSDWVFQGMVDGEGLDGSDPVLQQSNQAREEVEGV